MASAVGGAGWKNISPVVARTFTNALEQLQESYVAAVAATAGCTVERKGRDVHGIDLEITRPAEPPAQEVTVLVQLKSTTTVAPNPVGQHFSYQFHKRPHLERLAAPRKSPKLILVVMVCPQTQGTWTTCTPMELTMRHCCYWVSLEGAVVTPGVQAPTVRVPTANVFDAAALTTIMDKLDKGVPLV